MKIVNITSRKIQASFGNETVEATITFSNGSLSTAAVPAGISAGKYEVVKVSPDLAINQISEMNLLLSGKEWTQEALDATISTGSFGGNSTLAVSASFWRSNKAKTQISNFPKLMLLLFEGGRHGNPANKALSIQEFMLLEDSVAGADQAFKSLRSYLDSSGIETLVGAEGGFSPSTFDNQTVLETLKKVFPEKKICLDVADTFMDEKGLDFNQIISNFNIASIEDPFSDEGWDKWVEFTKIYGSKIIVVGDDLVTTNPDRIKKAIDLGAINAVIIKPNQIGTITGAIQAIHVARQGNLKIIVSHRGEETDDTWIVDFALAVQADYVKFGGMDRGERIAKYNRLRELGMK